MRCARAGSGCRKTEPTTTDTTPDDDATRTMTDVAPSPRRPPACPSSPRGWPTSWRGSTASSARSTCSSPRRRPRPPATRRGEPRRPRSSDRDRGRDVGRRDAGPDGRRRPQRAARPADQARRADGVAGRRPRGQATRARPLPRCARPRTSTRSARSATSRSRRAGQGRRRQRRPRPGVADPNGVPPAVSRLLLGAQEDLRREIARAMHDGPAQSLTNIVLQAQIVERLVDQRPGQGRARGPPARGDGPADARGDQVVHLRRPPDGPRRPGPRADAAASGPRARTTGRRPGRVRLDGPGPAAADGPRERPLPDPRRGDGRRISASAPNGLGPPRLVRPGRGAGLRRRAPRSRPRSRRRPRPAADADLPPALAAMMEDRRADARDAVEAARRDAIVELPPSTWREIQSRAVDARAGRRAVGRRRRAPTRR